MRKLMAISAIVFTASVASPSWAFFGLENLSFDGSLETSAVNAKNEVDQNDDATTSDRRSDVDTRLRLGLNAEVTEGVKSRIELTRTGSRYGRSLPGGSGAGSANHLQDEQDNIEIQNAFIEFANILGVRARLGRQYVGNAGDLVWNFSPRSDDNLSVRALDALTIWHAWPILNLVFTAGKAEETDAQGAITDSDVSLKALDLMFPTLIPGGSINVGYLAGRDGVSNSTTDDNKLKIYRAGVRGGVRENWLTYRAEWFGNDGSLGAMDYEGSALDLGVGLNIGETRIGGWSFGANFLSASGDDNASDTKDESFRDFRALGASSSDRYYGEIFGRSNYLAENSPITGLNSPMGNGADTGAQGAGLEVLHLGAKWMPTFAPKGSIALDWYNFSTAENRDADTTGAIQNSDKLGTEIDLTFGYKHSDNVNLAAGIAMFSPDDLITGVGATPAQSDDSVRKLFGRLDVKWGGGMEQID